MKNSFFAFFALICASVQAQTTSVVITTPQQEGKTLEILLKTGKSFSLTVMPMAEALAFQAHLQAESDKKEGVIKRTILGDAMSFRGESVCYSYWGNNYQWGNWNWYAPVYQSYNYNNFGYSNYYQPYNYVNPYTYGRIGFGFQFYLGF